MRHPKRVSAVGGAQRGRPLVAGGGHGCGGGRKVLDGSELSTGHELTWPGARPAGITPDPSCGGNVSEALHVNAHEQPGPGPGPDKPAKASRTRSERLLEVR